MRIAAAVFAVAIAVVIVIRYAIVALIRRRSAWRVAGPIKPTRSILVRGYEPCSPIRTRTGDLLGAIQEPTEPFSV